MNPILLAKAKKLSLVLVLGFFGLFGFRLWYGYNSNPESLISSSQTFSSISEQKRNYASKEHKMNSTPNTPAATSIKVDQKYEKIAEINTKSSAFEAEETETKKYIDQYESLIQFEQKSGNKGNRKLLLLIGVPPQNFDSLYTQLSKIGTVQAKQITKKDKTNEYKALNAKKISLEKTRASLVELKTKGGQIKEFMELETQILDIEQQLQELGVSLGDFDAENEFCTIQFSLLEGKESKISFLHRVKVALEWTIWLYLQLMALFFFLSAGAFFAVWAFEKFKKHFYKK